jgi:hypothetical protein
MQLALFAITLPQSPRAVIEKLLSRCDHQSLTAEFVRLFRPDVDPEGWGVSTRQWLMRIQELLRSRD